MAIDAEFNRKSPFSTELNKILLDLLRLGTKEEKHEIQFSQYTEVNGPKAHPGSKLCS